jgi:two-component system phosphate regulon response regulator OmpR
MSERHIVVVDDEPQIRDTMREYLELHGYRVSEADGGASLRALVAEGEVMDLVVLDITMPGEDGLSLARFLREHTDTAIIMATAAGEVVDRIVGLEMGADDYLAKPVDLRELLARIKAVLRRGGEGGAVAPERPADERPFGDFVLDVARRKLFDASGAEVVLTAMEFDLVRAFAENPDRVLTRDQLLEQAHHRRWEPFDRSIDIRVGRLRRKLERDPGSPRLIKTVHGVGYVHPGSTG